MQLGSSAVTLTYIRVTDCCGNGQSKGGPRRCWMEHETSDTLCLFSLLPSPSLLTPYPSPPHTKLYCSHLFACPASLESMTSMGMNIWEACFQAQPLPRAATGLCKV